MQQFINVFFSVKLYPALMIALLIFMRNCEKRKYFLLRFLSSVLIIGYFTWLIWDFAGTLSGMIGHDSDFHVISYVLADLIYLGLIVASAMFSFRCSVFEALLYAIGAWVTEHLANSFAVCIAIWTNMSGFIYRDYSFEFFLTTLVVYFVIYVMMYVITIILGKDRLIDLDRKRIILPVFLLVFTVMVLSSFTPYSDMKFLAICKLYAIACCIINLCVIFSLFETGKYKIRVETLEQLDKRMSEQYEISKDTIDMINTKCHDLKKYVGSALAQKTIMTEEEIEELNQKLSIYDSFIKTGNRTFDVVLSEKSLVCEKNKIKLTVMADASRLDYLTDMEVYSLFTNIMDNAMEAVQKLEEEKRVITLSVKATGNMIVIHEENYYKGVSRGIDGKLKTSKEDKINHGYGLVSIEKIAKKYGGSMSISVQDSFKINVLLPLNREKI